MKNIFSLVRLFFKDTASHFPFPRTCSSQKWQSKNVRGFERVRMLTLVFSMLVALILAHPASAQPRLFVDLDPLTPGIQTDPRDLAVHQVGSNRAILVQIGIIGDGVTAFDAFKVDLFFNDIQSVLTLPQPPSQPPAIPPFNLAYSPQVSGLSSGAEDLVCTRQRQQLQPPEGPCTFASPGDQLRNDGLPIPSDLPPYSTPPPPQLYYKNSLGGLEFGNFAFGPHPTIIPAGGNASLLLVELVVLPGVVNGAANLVARATLELNGQTVATITSDPSLVIVPNPRGAYGLADGDYSISFDVQPVTNPGPSGHGSGNVSIKGGVFSKFHVEVDIFTASFPDYYAAFFDCDPCIPNALMPGEDDVAGNFVGNVVEFFITDTSPPPLTVRTRDTIELSGQFFPVGSYFAFPSPTRGDGAIRNVRFLPIPQPLIVTNAADAGPGSLRQAVIDAPNGGIIAFDPNLRNQPITLLSGQINIDKDLTIQGFGALDLVISGNNASRVFKVSSGATVGITDMAMQNGRNLFDEGAGIRNEGNLSLERVRITGNVASTRGSGIWNSGSLSLVDTTVDNNITNASGAGIVNAAAGIMTVLNSTISGNRATQPGGGCGGIRNESIMMITNSTIAFNEAGEGGGGICAFGSLQLLTNTIVAKNSAPIVNLRKDCNGTVNSNGHNIDSDGSCGLDVTKGDRPNTDPKLGALLLNGGPTPTHVLLFNSLAIDNGSDCSIKTDHDQRGLPRPRGGKCDIGAYEQYAPLDINSDGKVDRNDVLMITAPNGSNLNKPATSPNDPRDQDGDGIITILDARKLIQFCDKPACAP
jgi:hypothetical protein